MILPRLQKHEITRGYTELSFTHRQNPVTGCNQVQLRLTMEVPWPAKARLMTPDLRTMTRQHREGLEQRAHCIDVDALLWAASRRNGKKCDARRREPEQFGSMRCHVSAIERLAACALAVCALAACTSGQPSGARDDLPQGQVAATSPASTPDSADTPAAPPRVEDGPFTLSFRDEFDRLDSARWQLMTHSWGGNLALFSRESARVEQGLLTLTLLAAPEGTVDDQGEAKRYLGAEVRSRETLTYGRVRARVKFAKAPAVVSALVTIYTPWPADDWNELDIEALGADPTRVQFNAQVYTGPPTEPPVLVPVSPTQDPHLEPLGFDFSEDFHEYTIEWTPDAASFWVDGELRYSWSERIDSMKLPQNVLLTIWASDSANWAGAVAPETTGATAIYDWVELWTFDAQRFDAIRAGSSGAAEAPTASADDSATPAPEPSAAPGPAEPSPPQPTPMSSEGETTTSVDTGMDDTGDANASGDADALTDAAAGTAQDPSDGALDDAAGSGDAEDGFQLLFRDDFDELDGNRWQRMTHSWDSNLALFSAESVAVSDGLLTLTLLDAPAGTSDDTGASKRFLGAEVRSNATIEYGRVTARARMSSGSGVVSALVTIYTPWPADDWNELDIEHLGAEPGQVQFNAMAYTGNPTTPPVTSPVTPTQFPQLVDLGFDASLDFHEYTIEWTPQGASFYVDGQLRHTWNERIDRFGLPQNVLLTIWASASADWAGPITANSSGASVAYDWVEVYEYTPRR